MNRWPFQMEVFSLIVTLIKYSVFIGLALGIALFIVIIFTKRYFKLRKKGQPKEPGNRITVGFFHPYCNAGGGGERVLWCALRALQLKHPDVRTVIYTGDCDSTPEDILTHAKEKFNIVLPKKVDFIFLKKRAWVEAQHYPYFTLIRQSVGSMVLAFEAIILFMPDVLIDSMGYPFSYFIFKSLANCRVGCYIHYPTISADMLSTVSDRTGSFNNRTVIANSVILTNLKLLYYWLFASLYGSALSRADVVMVNSTWTKGHIKALWGDKAGRQIIKVFPPCDIKSFLDIPLERPSSLTGIKNILSINQFRPEKNHKLQVTSFAKFLSGVPQQRRQHYRLILVGGCRNQGDADRVDELIALAGQLQISEHVQIKVNISFNELEQLLSASHIGLHTMKNEHFGIGVVEFQAAGVIALAHNSGGPKMDIVIGDKEKKTGFLAETTEEYAKAIEEIFMLSSSDRNQIASSARLACERFSESQFENDFLNAALILLNNWNSW